MDFQENTKAIYLQIADSLCNDIITGKYPEESRIPSVREYAANVQVNANTVMRAYDYLQQSGIIFNKRGIGYFVAEGASTTIRNERMEKFMNNDLKQLFEELHLLGISPKQLVEMYEEYCKKNN
ncbi:MAG: GntR family transcriptional regulator [Muribaculaceae bacterium]|nr:GntR family transcriptional regulator [Muribaculaceae bacterium]